MNTVKEITLKKYRKVIKNYPNNYFQNSYIKLQLGDELNQTEIFHLLKNA